MPLFSTKLRRATTQTSTMIKIQGIVWRATFGQIGSSGCWAGTLSHAGHPAEICQESTTGRNTKKDSKLTSNGLGVIRKHALMRAVEISAAVTGLALLACSLQEPIRILNDLEFEVALVRCESKSLATDEVYIPPGESRSVRPGTTCSVQGPPRKGGLFGSAKLNGPYIGCLSIPDDTKRSGITLRISEADPSVSFASCDSPQ